MIIVNRDWFLLLFLPHILVSRLTLGVTSLGRLRGECVFLFKTDSPLRFEELLYLKIYYWVDVLKPVRALCIFPGKDDEKLDIFPLVICHFEDVFI